MAQSFACGWCASSFKTEDGLQWHVESHLREWGLVVYLDPKWGGLGISISELPGECLIVLPALSSPDMPEEELVAAIKADIARFGPIVRAVEQVTGRPAVARQRNMQAEPPPDQTS